MSSITAVNLAEVVRVALWALARNRMRSALTMLGVIIGVAAVIGSVAVGEGASNQIQEQIRNMGDHMVWIEAGGRQVNGVRTGTRGTKSLTMGDLRAIQQQVPLVFNERSPVAHPGIAAGDCHRHRLFRRRRRLLRLLPSAQSGTP